MTTGNIPKAPQAHFFTAVFPNPDGGYEIFLFAGEGATFDIRYHGAYVLSLPGLFWRQVTLTAAGARSGHTCVAVRERQVLSVGGENSKGL